MFTSEQPYQQKVNIRAKKGSLKAGMALAKGERVIRKFTYKELTIIIGIIVALVIVFAVWSNNDVSGQSFGPSLKPKIETGAGSSFTKKVIAQVLAFTLR